MIVIGMQKKVDNLGRIVLPKDIRDLYFIGENDNIEIIPTDEGILIRKPGSKVVKFEY